MPKGIADHDPVRQRGEVDQFDAGGDGLHQPHLRRRWIFRAPVIGNEDVGIGRGLRVSQQPLWLGDDLDPQTARQFGPDAVRRVSGDIAKKERG